jgi:hypothetical protein
MWAIKLSKAINIRLIRLENGKENNFEVAVKLLPEIQLILTDQNAVNLGKHLESAGKKKKKPLCVTLTLVKNRMLKKVYILQGSAKYWRARLSGITTSDTQILTVKRQHKSWSGKRVPHALLEEWGIV